MRTSGLHALALLICGAVLPSCHSLDYFLGTLSKCVQEDTAMDAMVMADYKFFKKSDPTVAVPLAMRVEDPQGRKVWESKRTTDGTVPFTASQSGDFKTCFTARDVATAQDTMIRYDWKTGVAATDWDTIAKKENLDALTVQLRQVQDAVKGVHRQFESLRQREMEMRNLNELTNSRVAYYSIASMAICLVLGAAQLVYLRSFFKRKKVM